MHSRHFFGTFARRLGSDPSFNHDGLSTKNELSVRFGAAIKTLGLWPDK
jgi:hypothetical protein